ncbi:MULTISPECIES: COG1361 S-layer family protein [Methanocalculus]|uniref:COG1361 S-layer family protein n=1 Tax=Methanocalculus TaxID=71151 RepID=UPI00209E030D|nr:MULTISPECIES: hypothetical protein [unclassified Methanocalculus]MCP1662709.1 hypothetical protein [Methanocalculus sp. AMF5]
MLVAIPCTVAASATGSSVTVTSHEVVPDVVMPGDTALVHVTIENTAATWARTESVTHTYGVMDKSTSDTRDVYLVIGSVFLDGRKDIRVLEGNSAFSGVLGPGQSMELSFLIQAPEKSGIYFPQLRIGVSGGENVIYPIPVNVNMPVYSMKKPIIQVSQSDLPFVAPGETFETELCVTNIGESAAQDFSVSVSMGDLMISPVGPASSAAPVLAPGSDLVLPLLLRVGKEIEPGLYDLPVMVTYTRVDGSLQQETATASADVRGASSLAVSQVRTDPITVSAGEPFDLVIRLENTGTGRAESVSAEIDLPLTGTRESFVGSIRPGNDAPAVFRLTADGDGEMPYTLTVHYSDDYGDHELRQPLVLVVRPKGMDGTVIAFVIIVLLAGAGYYLYRQRQQG